MNRRITGRPTWRDDEPPRIRCRVCGERLISVTACHLRSHPELDFDHPLEDYKRRFRLKYAVSPTARRNMAYGQRQRYLKEGRAWSRERIVAEIRSRDRKGLPLHTAAVRWDHSALAGAAGTYFGSWRSAITAAGFHYPEVKRVTIWDRRMVTRKIREWGRAENPLNAAAMERGKGKPIVRHGRELFGSWKRALRAAGVDPTKVYKTRVWSDRRFIASIRAIARAGRSLKGVDVSREDSSLVYLAARRWGSWGRAVEAAGFEYNFPDRPIRWSKESVIEWLRKRAASGRTMGPTELKERMYGLYKASERLFGSWRAAYAAAAVEAPIAARFWPKERVVKTLRRLRDEGVWMSTPVVTHKNRGVVRAAVNRFGSWGAACRAAGVEPQDRRTQRGAT